MKKTLSTVLQGLSSMVGFVEGVQARVVEVMQLKDVQYLVAFKDHMTAMSLQLEQLRREVGRPH